MRLDQDIPLFDKCALCAARVGAELWVGSMSGQILALNSELAELRRWQAHAGSVNGIMADGTSYGGDGLVISAHGDTLAGPYKKAVTKVQRADGTLYAGTYERALYIGDQKHSKIAAWHLLPDGGRVQVRQTGSKVGDLGPIERDGAEIGPPAWTLSAGPDGCIRAFLTDGRFVELSLATGEVRVLPWESPQGPPTVAADRYFIGNHLVYDTHTGEDLRLETKGLYGAALLTNDRLAIAGADGNLKVIDLAAP